MPSPGPGAGLLRTLVARATLAPSTLNAQPWRWTVHPDHVELSLDEHVAERFEHNDPMHRELVMSCGAALLTFRVAAAEALFDTAVDTSPDPHRPGLLAAVTVEPGAIDAAFAELDAVVPLRHTAWSKYDGRPLPEGLSGRLVAEAAVEGVSLCELAEDGRAGLADLLRHADRERFDDADRRAELAEWISSPWSDHGRVVPTAAVVPARAAVRHLDLGDRIADHDAVLLEDAPYVAVLATPQDTVTDWLAAGQALQRVLLVAAGREVCGGFLNAPCQVERDRARLRALLPHRPFPQVVLRLGYPLVRPLGTPRRPVDAVVTVDDGPNASGHDDLVPGLAREVGADFTEDTLG